MSKKQLPILYGNLIYTIGNYFLYIHYLIIIYFNCQEVRLDRREAAEADVAGEAAAGAALQGERALRRWEGAAPQPARDLGAAQTYAWTGKGAIERGK